MRRFRGLCADGPGSLRRYFNLPRQSLSIRRAAAPHPASWGRSLRTRRCAPQGKHEARLVFEIPGVSAKTEAPQPPDTHTHMELLARPPGGGSGHGDADGGGTRGGDTRGRGGAWAAERAVAAVLAAAGGGGWAAAGGDIAGGSHAGAALLWRRGGGVAAPCRSRPARIALAVCRRGRRIRMRPPRRQTVGWPQSRTWVKSCGAETSSFAVAGPSITGAVAG